MVDQGSAPSTDVDLAAVEEALQLLVGARKQLEAARELRAFNSNPKRPSGEVIKQLDSSIKRNAALVKKLRQMSEESCTSLLDEIGKINQSKYVSEIVAAVSEAPLNVKDLAAALQVCSLLHQRYAEFGEQIAPGLARVFITKPASAEEDRALAKRKRTSLRLLSDLMAAGICPPGPQPLLGIVQDLASVCLRKDREAGQNALALLSHFAKGAREHLLGLPPVLPVLPLVDELLKPSTNVETEQQLPSGTRDALVRIKVDRQALDAELKERFQAPAEDRAAFGKAVSRAFQAGCSVLSEDHKALCEQEQENMRIVNSRGDLPADVAAEYEKRRKAYEGLHRAVASLAESLDQPMPELVEDAFTRLGALEGGALAAATSGQAGQLEEHVFEDLESRMFYESLPDIRSMVPGVLLGLTTESTPAEVEPAPASAGSAAAEEAQPASPSTTPSDVVVAGAVAAPSSPEVVDGAGKGIDTKAEAVAQDETAAPSAPNQIDIILNKLQHCVSRDTCDELSVNFCFSNSKGARKRLVRALCDVPRSCLQLVPFYARILATLAPVFPDMLQGVLSFLEAEFQVLLVRKDATSLTLEQRIRNARYMAELAKYKLYPPGSFFVALKQLLDDFAHHNVDAACAMVETAGRVLIRMPETKVRMENMLEVMMRLKNVKNLDARRCAQVEWAYLAVKQPGRAAPRKQRPPMQEYIRHLILVRLNKTTVGEVAKKLLKVPWAEHERYILKCLLKVVRGRFTNIALVSALVGGLAQMHDSLGIAFVDQVLEDIRWGLENPMLGTYQKRLADVRILGELYNYSLFNSTPVFETLYLIITFGHEMADLAMKIDPPDDYYRIRMVCTLLDTCGVYFNEGRAASKLDRFITFFQAYILSKQQPVPLDVEFDVQDVLHHLRPRLSRYSSYEEALQAVSDIISQEAVTGGGGMLGAIDEDDDDDERREPPPESEDEDDEVAASGRSSFGGSSGGRRDEDEGIDADFEREYMQLMFETQGKAVGKAPTLLPPSVLGASAAANCGATGGPVDDDEGMIQDNMAFKLLMKKGGKDDRSKEIMVPASARIAISLREREDAEAREREEMKRLTLMANRQQEQEQAALHRAQMRGTPTPLSARPHVYQPGQQNQAPQATAGGEGNTGGQHRGAGGGGRHQPSQHQFGNVDALGLDYQSVPRGLRHQQGGRHGGRGGYS